MEDKLKVGDVIFTERNGQYHKHIIEKITPKAAISGSTKFKVEQSQDGSFAVISPDKWGPYSATGINESIINWYTKQRKHGLCERIKAELDNRLLDGWRIDKFESVLKIVSEK